MEQGALVRDIVLYKLYKYLENQGCELSVGNKINPSKEPAYVKKKTGRTNKLLQKYTSYPIKRKVITYELNG